MRSSKNIINEYCPIGVIGVSIKIITIIIDAVYTYTINLEIFMLRNFRKRHYRVDKFLRNDSLPH